MANADQRTPIVVGGFTLDLDREALVGSDGEIRLRPKTFEVLRHLLMHRGRVVTKQALIDAVWGHTSVTDDSLVQCLIEIRRALGDDGHRLIKTIPRRGYMVADGEAKADGPRAIPGRRARVWLWSLLAVLAGGAAAAAMYFRGGSDLDARNPTS